MHLRHRAIYESGANATNTSCLANIQESGANTMSLPVCGVPQRQPRAPESPHRRPSCAAGRQSTRSSCSPAPSCGFEVAVRDPRLGMSVLWVHVHTFFTAPGGGSSPIQKPGAYTLKFAARDSGTRRLEVFRGRVSAQCPGCGSLCGAPTLRKRRAMQRNSLSSVGNLPAEVRNGGKTDMPRHRVTFGWPG